MSILVLLRHGQSQWNLENRFTGWVDVPLTEQGRAEAHHAGQRLREAGLSFAYTFTSELVRAQDVRHVVHLQELFDDLRAKRVSRAAGTQTKFVPLGVRVAPHQVGHRALVRDLAEAVDDFDLVDGVD